MAEQINYLGKDFTSLRTELINKVKEKGAWKDFYEGGMGVALLELFSFVGDQFNFYINRAANEAHLPTALDINSLINISKLVGYAWPKSSSASTTVKLSMDTTKTEAVTIDAYTRVQSAAGYEYITEENMTIAVGQSDATVSVIQGERIERENVGTSDGLVDQKFDLAYYDIAGNSGWIICEIGPLYTPYTVVDSFAGYDATSKVCVVSVQAEDRMQVEFGDGALGQIPPSGHDIFLTYLRTAGEAAKGGVGSINAILDNIYTDISLVQVTDINVASLSAVAGGADLQSLEDAQNDIPLWVRSLDRMVTKGDYETLVRLVQGVYDVQVLDVNDQSGAEVIPFRFAKVYVRCEGDSTLTNSIEAAVSDEIERKALIGTLFEINQVTYISVNVNLTVYRATGYSISTVTPNVQTALEDWFAKRSNTGIAENLLVQDLVGALANIEGVASYTLTLPTTNTVVGAGQVAALGTLTVVDGGVI